MALASSTAAINEKKNILNRLSNPDRAIRHRDRFSINIKSTIMKQRINPFVNGAAAMKAVYALGSYVMKCPDQHLHDLISFRISQINGCAYCLDMHSKDLRANGETEQRLYMLDAWRESPLYSERERAALAWAEAVNNLHDGRVSDEVYDEAQRHFSEKELIDLTMGVLAINCYNRINIAFRTPAGDYKVGQHTVHAN